MGRTPELNLSEIPGEVHRARETVGKDYVPYSESQGKDITLVKLDLSKVKDPIGYSSNLANRGIPNRLLLVTREKGMAGEPYIWGSGRVVDLSSKTAYGAMLTFERDFPNSPRSTDRINIDLGEDDVLTGVRLSYIYSDEEGYASDVNGKVFNLSFEHDIYHERHPESIGPSNNVYTLRSTVMPTEVYLIFGGGQHTEARRSRPARGSETTSGN